MTIIAAMRDAEEGVTWIGSDTMSVNNDTCVYGIQKWIIRKPWAVGIAGELRTINIVQSVADDFLSGLAGAFDFTKRFTGLLEQEGYSPTSELGSRGYGQQAILAHPGGVWSIGSDMSIVEIPDGELWADGCGRAYALGAAYSLNGKPKAMVRAGLSAAIRYSDMCGGEPQVMKLHW